MTILLAILFDLLLGDPPNRYHPVAWMGRLLSHIRDHAPQTPRARFLWGGTTVLSAATLIFALAQRLQPFLSRLPRPIALTLEATVLKSTFALRGLQQAANEVAQALHQNNLPQARHLVAWHLVSRDTSNLPASQVAAATIESIAENASDGLVAPLTAYALGGLPAALTYRFLNTADAMLGYRDAQYEWLGKIPARVDDLLNLIPSRLTAGLLVLASVLLKENAAAAWRTWRRDAHLTASPNAGHPMAAMSGALKVRLEKTGHYRLGAEFPPPQPTDISRAIRLLQGIGLLAAILTIALRHFTRNSA